MAGINRRAAPTGEKGKPPASTSKEGEVLQPTTGFRLSIGDLIAIVKEATGLAHEAVGFLSEREKTRRAIIESQHELERISADLEKERQKHEVAIRRLDQNDKVVETVLAQLADLREGIRPLLAEVVNLDHQRVQTLLALLEKITTLQSNLLAQCRH